MKKIQIELRECRRLLSESMVNGEALKNETDLLFMKVHAIQCSQLQTACGGTREAAPHEAEIIKKKLVNTNFE
jgi:hypothetical protein